MSNNNDTNCNIKELQPSSLQGTFYNHEYAINIYQSKCSHCANTVENPNTKNDYNFPNIFELAWDDGDLGFSFLYTHPKKTELQFKDDIELQLKKYGKEYLKSEISWASAEGWIEFINDKMPELGYYPINPKRWSYRGGFIIEDENSSWGDVVGKELFNESLAHNKKIEKEIFGDETRTTE